MHNNNLPIIEEWHDGSIIYQSRNMGKKRIKKPAFLGVWSSRRSFLRGIASLGNICGRSSFLEMYMKGSVSEDLRRDWETVGYDIAKAMSLY